MNNVLKVIENWNVKSKFSNLKVEYFQKMLYTIHHNLAKRFAVCQKLLLYCHLNFKDPNKAHKVVLNFLSQSESINSDFMSP